MTLPEYINICHFVQSKYPSWRMGQTYMNILTAVDYSLAYKIYGSIYDPFYNDSFIGEFIKFLSNNWNDQAEHEINAEKSSFYPLIKDYL